MYKDWGLHTAVVRQYVHIFVMETHLWKLILI